MTLLEIFWERYELGQGVYIGQCAAHLDILPADKINWPTLANYDEVILWWDGRDEFGHPIRLEMTPVVALKGEV